VGDAQMRYVGIKGRVWEVVKASVRRREKDCYTCPNKNLQGRNAQAGHYRPVSHVGSSSQWSWDPRFIHLQCSRCNGAGAGMQVEYREHLVRDYGEDAVADFDNNFRKPKPVTDWQEIIDAFNEDLNQHA
jgi:hypothetical protein